MERGIAGNGGGRPTSLHSDGKVSDIAGIQQEPSVIPKPTSSEPEVEDIHSDTTSEGDGHHGSGTVSTTSEGTDSVSADLSSSARARDEEDTNGEEHGSSIGESASTGPGSDALPGSRADTGGLSSSVRSPMGVLVEEGRSLTHGDRVQGLGTSGQGSVSQETSSSLDESSTDTMKVDRVVNGQSNKPRTPARSSKKPPRPPKPILPPLPPKPVMFPTLGREPRFPIRGVGLQRRSPFVPKSMPPPFLSSIGSTTDPFGPALPVPEGMDTEFWSSMDLSLRMQMHNEELMNMGLFGRPGEPPVPPVTSVRDMITFQEQHSQHRDYNSVENVGTAAVPPDPKGKGKLTVENHPSVDDSISSNFSIFDYDLTEEENGGFGNMALTEEQRILCNDDFSLESTLSKLTGEKGFGDLVATAEDPKGKGKMVAEYPSLLCDPNLYQFDDEDEDDAVTPADPKGKGKMVAENLSKDYFGWDRKGMRELKLFAPKIIEDYDDDDVVTVADPKGKGKMVARYRAGDYYDLSEDDEEGSTVNIIENGRREHMIKDADDYSVLAELLSQEKGIQTGQLEPCTAPPYSKGKGKQEETMESLGNKGASDEHRSRQADPRYYGSSISESGNRRPELPLRVPEPLGDEQPKRQRLSPEEERLAEINRQWKDRMERLGTPCATRHPSAEEPK